MNCHKLNGAFKKTITVQTNDPKHQTVQLVCDGQILESIKMKPNRVFFGRMSRGGEAVERTVQLEKGDAGPITPKLKPFQSDEVTAELKEVVPHERYELVVRGKVKPSSTRINTVLKIETGVEAEPEAELRVYGMIPPRVTVSPSRLSIPTDAPASWSQSATLIWNEGGPHDVLSAEIDYPGLEVETREINDRWMVTLKATEGFEPFRATKRIAVKTDDEDMPVVQIPVMCRRIRSNRTSSNIERRVPVHRAPAAPVRRAPAARTGSAEASKSVDAEAKRTSDDAEKVNAKKADAPQKPRVKAAGTGDEDAKQAQPAADKDT